MLHSIGVVFGRRSFLLGATVLAIAGARVEAADLLAKGAADYKPFAVERIEIALTGARKLQAAVKAGDVKAAQAAWPNDCKRAKRCATWC